MAEARIDKWMWAVRIFKTRTIAAEACKMNRVTINGAYVKASRMIKPGDSSQETAYHLFIQSATSYRKASRCQTCTRYDGKCNNSRPI